MRALVYLLSYPNERFRGRVQGVGWALYQNNGASIEGLPQVEETLNWVRLSQKVPGANRSGTERYGVSVPYGRNRCGNSSGHR